MIGQTVGKYRIVSRLGRGGMGTVYKAVDETLGREVAVKILNPDLADAEVLKRFRAEAVTLARLNHPNIAILYELTEHEDDLVMVMEFVRGETFDRLSDRLGPLPFERAAALCAQVLDALGHAHRAGIVHRDLKPANLMIADSGIVKVMDFGIARMVGTEHLTTDGYMMGTPAYMAPEQVMGNEVDGRADLYSIGVVLYRLLTANLPFKADTAIAMVQKQIKDPPTPLHQFRNELPAWCQGILDRALAKAPHERFQTAEEFRASLGHALAPNASAEVPTAAVAVAGIAASDTSDVEVTVPPNVMFTPVAAVRPNAAGVGMPPPIVDAPAPAAAKPAPQAAPVQRTVRPKRRAPSALLAAAGAVILLAGTSAAWVLTRNPPAAESPTSGSPAPAPAPPAAAPVASPATAHERQAQPHPGSGTDSVRAVAKPGAARVMLPPGPKASATPAAASSTAAAPAVLAPTLPPLTFQSIAIVMVDDGKPRERDASLHLREGAVQVLDGAQRLKNAPYAGIIAIFYSRSKEPRWVTPSGAVVPVVKMEGSRLRLFGGNRDWVTVRTRGEFIPIRVESAAVAGILSALEARTGLKVTRASAKD